MVLNLIINIVQMRLQLYSLVLYIVDFTKLFAHICLAWDDTIYQVDVIVSIYVHKFKLYLILKLYDLLQMLLHWCIYLVHVHVERCLVILKAVYLLHEHWR